MILLAAFLSLATVLKQSTAQAPDLTSLSTDNVDQQKEIVDKHNALRRGVMPTASNMMRMEWSPEAAQNAKNWANEYTLSHSPPERSKTTVDCGENLYISSAPSSWSDAIQSWYNEVEDFKYGIGATRPIAVTDHYTQFYHFRGNDENLIKTPYKSGAACADCPNDCDNGLCTNPCKYEDGYFNCPDLDLDVRMCTPLHQGKVPCLLPLRC